MKNGIFLNGKFYKAEWINDLVDIVVTNATVAVTDKVLNELDVRLNHKEEEKMYTVSEIARIVKKANSTVTYHIRIGILVAHKVGKSWLVTDENFQKYKLNQ